MSNTYNTQQGRNAGSIGLILLDRGRQLVHWLVVVALVCATANSLSVWRDTWSGRTIGSDSSLPCLLEQERGCTGAVLGSNDTPEGSTVGFVDVAKTLLVNV